MNILISGASGFVGQNLIKSLIASGHNVSACVHQSELNNNVKIFKINYAQMLRVTDWLPLLSKIDIVINCAGIISESKNSTFDVMHHLAPVALFKACEKTYVKRIIQVSALGADDLALTGFHQSKKQADNFLRQSSVDWFILRPSLIYGNGGKSYAFFKLLSNLPLVPLIGSGQQLLQPINVHNVIEVIEKCLTSKHPNQTIDLVGKHAITYQQLMRQLRSKKAPVRFVKLPMKLIKFLAWIVKPLSLKLLTKDNLTMLQQNNISDVVPLLKFMENN